MRLVTGHLGHQPVDVRRGDVGRIAQDKVEPRLQRGRPVAAQESRAVREAERDGVGGRQAGGFRRAVQADAESARELVQGSEQEAAGAGAEVNDVAGW